MSYIRRSYRSDEMERSFPQSSSFVPGTFVERARPTPAPSSISIDFSQFNASIVAAGQTSSSRSSSPILVGSPRELAASRVAEDISRGKSSLSASLRLVRNSSLVKYFLTDIVEQVDETFVCKVELG